MINNKKIFGELTHRYTDGIKNKKIIVIGPYPPPIGGVAVHVKRVIAKLKKQNNIVYCFDSTAKHRWRFSFYLIKLFFFIMFVRPNIIFYNTIYLTNSLSELRLLSFLKKIFCFSMVCIEHNCRHMYKRDERFKKALSRFLKNKNIVLIGDSTYKSYIESGIVLPETFSVESAFLSPDLSEEQKIIKTYPQSLFAFIKSADPLIVANAFQLSLIDGKDLYGFDVCIDLIHELKKTYPNTKLVLALAKVGNENYFAILKKKMKHLGVEKNIYILSDQRQLWPLIKMADLFVRPTLSDSFGISIAEALLFDVPAVASNVCIRPVGTILFKCGDKRDFFDKVQQILNDRVVVCLPKKKSSMRGNIR